MEKIVLIPDCAFISRLNACSSVVSLNISMWEDNKQSRTVCCSTFRGDMQLTHFMRIQYTEHSKKNEKKLKEKRRKHFANDVAYIPLYKTGIL